MDEHPWMSKDLLVRLRWWAFKFCGKGEHENLASGAMSEAVDHIEKLEAALRKIADIEHEDLPKPAGAAEGTLWVILAGCVEVAEKALEGKDD
jgi:hypothetical protein